MHSQQVLAMQQCSPRGSWQLPSCSGHSHSHSRSTWAPVLHCSSVPVLRVASTLRTQSFPSSSQRFRVSLPGARQRCRVPNSQATGRSMEELEQGKEFEQLEEEDLDALFEEYGEVVRTDEESNSVTSEVDEDSDSLAFAVAMAEAANDVKGSEIQVLCVKPLIYWARFFVVVTAFSKPQIDAVGKRMREMAEQKFHRSPKGDSKPNAWTLLDFGDVVVHIFLPKERAFYNLEEFYGNATLVSLPFETRSVQ